MPVDRTSTYMDIIYTVFKLKTVIQVVLDGYNNFVVHTNQKIDGYLVAF